MIDNPSGTVIRMKDHGNPAKWHEGVISDMVQERDALDKAVRRAAWWLDRIPLLMLLSFVAGGSTALAVVNYLR
jgi:hypothetical protein